MEKAIESEIDTRQEYKVMVNIEYRVLSNCFPSSIGRDFETYATDMICEENQAGQNIILKELDVSTHEQDEFESTLDEFEDDDE